MLSFGKGQTESTPGQVKRKHSMVLALQQLWTSLFPRIFTRWYSPWQEVLSTCISLDVRTSWTVLLRLALLFRLAYRVSEFDLASLNVYILVAFCILHTVLHPKHILNPQAKWPPRSLPQTLRSKTKHSDLSSCSIKHFRTFSRIQTSRRLQLRVT